ncbi:MAG: DegQ family serine endoprotease [Alphaproteobacteria bacterium]
MTAQTIHDFAPAKTGGRPPSRVRSAQFGLAAAAFAAGILALANGAFARAAPDSFSDLAEKLLPAVVNVSTTQVLKETSMQNVPELPQFPPGSPFEEFFRDFFERHLRPDAPPHKATSLGSGFVIDPSGIIVTNNHVISDADEISVILQDNTTLKAEIIGRDPKVDVALLRVKADKPLPAVKFGDSDAARVGDWVMAIGNPFGLGGTVTVGIVSAHHRDINIGPYDDFIQTDASINRGNSGGPMFNMAGEVIGITTAIFSPSGGSVGLGFAIPASLAKPVVDQLKEFGHTKRGWLGVRIQAVTDEIAASLGLKEPKGALIAKVNEGEPAATGGMQAGDIVLSFDNQEVSDFRKLQRIVAETPVGKKVKVTVWRNEKEVPIEITLGELEKYEETTSAEQQKQEGAAETTKGVEMFGLKLAEITAEIRAKFDLPGDAKGVIITEVAATSDAAEKGLRAGDVIYEVNQADVATPAEVEANVDKAKKAGRKWVLLGVSRQGNLQFVPLKVGEG